MSKKYNAIPAGYEEELYGDEDDELDSISRTAQNLKITIVPDITTEAGINGVDFDCSLDAAMDNWFDSFRLMWNSYKRTPAAQQSLKTVLMNDRQPLLLALKFFANCPGCNNLKNKNLALFILETLCDLYKQHPDIASSCDDNTRMVAFNFTKTCGISALYKSVLQTFELHKIREVLVPKIEQLIMEHQYKDAAYWAMLLQVTHLFGLYEIVFPLILQDKVFLAEEYLNIAKVLQLPTVQFLDSLLDKQKSVYEHCNAVLAKYKYDDVRHNILSYRPMSKLVTRLAKKYKIDSHLTPNLNFSKACSYMHYLHRKYQDGGMSFDSWRELIRDAAITKELQVDLVNNVATHGDLEEAIYWARYFQVRPEQCPNYMRTHLEQHLKTIADESQLAIAAAATVADNESATTNDDGMAQSNFIKQQKNPFRAHEYLELELTTDCIILVDRQEKFIEMIEYLEMQTLIAFDSEWKPTVCSDNVVSLLQLATFERVYLLDCLTKTQLSDDLWKLLGRNIFNNMEILKMGFSLKQDLQMLHKSLPALQLNLQNCSCYLDLRDLWRRLKYMQVIALNFGHATNSGESLCALSEVCLGKKLDKSNQCSNWANRPLRRDQINYAALDAHCLLQIYQVIVELLVRLGLDIDQIVDEVTTAKNSYLVNLKRNNGATKITDGLINSSDNEIVVEQDEGDISANITHSRCEVKFFCDNMLLGLAKELRKLGIDCVDMSKLDINDCIDLAKSESRYILTRDSRHKLFCQELPLPQCIEVPIGSSAEQVMNVISYLQLNIQHCNLFTRCIHCNCNEFIVARNEEMQRLRFGQIEEQMELSSSDNIYNLKSIKENFVRLPFNDDVMRTKRTHRGIAINLNRIKSNIFRTMEYIYICDNCGECSWDDPQSIPVSVREYIALSAGVVDQKHS